MKKSKFVAVMLLVVAMFVSCFALPNTSMTSYAKNASSKYSASSIKKYNGHLYQLVYENVTWSKADSIAKSYGGHLVTITSKKEQSFVWKQVKASRNSFSGHYWIGLYKKSGKWKWSTGEKVKYTHWGPDEPNNQGGSQKWALLNHYSDGTWDDESKYADSSTGFIIEWDGYTTSFKPAFSSITMNKGGSAKLSIVKKKKYTYDSSTSYKSSNPSVVKVSKSGKLTAKKKGSAKITITVKANGKSHKKTCKVKVK